ncbi:U3 small nucleolar RNA-associated protein 13 [Neophaeococcomyces mojaviensis]|uniref:U3 small nucleolar RNA-associated protein 13 n=1 Tax=Neophaeococcomyces mojaviensis TaxID=3383035 RepID=A0ACC3A585_9EURO|nr:U3 small nucleolar RNA-associated protein 13 [Knufia sp. JES_112]
MASKVTTKTTFKEYRAVEPFYTGGEIAANVSGNLLASTVDDEDCLIVDLSSTTPLCRIDGDGEAITSLALTPDASHVIICSRSLSMRIFQLSYVGEAVTAELLRSLRPHTTPVVASTTDSTGSLVVTGAADGVVKVWDIRGGYCSHNFHSHGGVITALEIFESKSASLNSKSGSSKKRKQDAQLGDAPQANNLFLASSGEDGRIKVHSLNTRQQVAILESHVSVVRALHFSPEQELMLSAGRDRTVVLWDVRSWTANRVIPATEELEAAGFILDGQYFYAGGEQGRVRIWATRTHEELETPAGRELENEAIVSIIRLPNQNALIAVRGNQVLEQLSYQSLKEQGPKMTQALISSRTFSGNHDEIIDMACIGTSMLAIADNTESVKVISVNVSDGTNQQNFGSNIAALEGHTDVVICMDATSDGRWLATGSKDNTARLWKLNADALRFECFAKFAGHTASIGAIGLPKSSTSLKQQMPQYLITGSEDKTVKKWDLSKSSNLATSILPHAIEKASFTRVAHEKDINAIDLSPTAPLFASASQDRIIKIWSVEDGSTTAILRGHKRGVWSIKFSPAEIPALNLSEGGSSGSRGLLVSGSGDNTVKVWSLNTYACLLTFEGHQNSVLKVLWLPPPPTEDSEDPRQQQRKSQPMIASASSDTLIKLWSPYASADSDYLLTTLDGHTDRVWSLATPLSFTSVSSTTKGQSKSPYSLISGAADAKLAFWTDTTATTTSESSKALTERVEQDQLLQNHILARNYKEVITLSLALNHPGRLLKVFEDVVNLTEAEREPDTLMGVKAVDDVLASLNQEQVYKLLERVRDWNTNARTATVAQKVLNCLLRRYPQSMWTEMAKDRNILRLAARTGAKGATKGNAMKDLFRALEAYTDKHYKRMEELIDESYLLEYTLREMDEIAGTVAATNGLQDVNKSEDVIMV